MRRAFTAGCVQRPPPDGRSPPARCILSATGSGDRRPAHQRDNVPLGGSVPASTILLIEADPAAGETIASVLTGVGYTVTTAADPNDAFAQVASNQLVDRRRRHRRQVRRGCLPRDPGHAVPRRDPGPVRQPDRRGRGADPLPRGRRRRRHGQAVRRPRARGSRRGAAPALPAVEGPERGRLDRRGHGHPDAADRSPSTARRAASEPRRSPSTSRWRPPSGKPDRVVIVDLDLQFGQVATHLNIQPRQTIGRRRPR